MDVEIIRQYCLSKPDVEECFPFDESTLVFKVQGKMFCLMDLMSEQLSFNLKCDPLHAIELREQYPTILPGYHMNKKHWNTIFVDGSIAPQLIYEMIDDSYSLVKKPIKKKK